MTSILPFDGMTIRSGAAKRKTFAADNEMTLAVAHLCVFNDILIFNATGQANSAECLMMNIISIVVRCYAICRTVIVLVAKDVDPW